MCSLRLTLLAYALALTASMTCGHAAELPNGWILASGEDPSADAAAVSVARDAEETIRDENDKNDVRPRLAFHCTPGTGEISASIDWRRFISSFNTDIGFQVDGGRTLWQKWRVDQSNMITSSRSEADSAALIDYIRSGKLLTVDIAPYAGSPIVVHFDLADFPEALEALRAECT